MQKLSVFILSLSFLFKVYANGDENYFILKGFIKDPDLKELLPGANVYIKESLKGTVTDAYGFYSLKLVKGTYTLIASYMGYQTFSRLVVLDADTLLNIDLRSESIITEAVVITAEAQKSVLRQDKTNMLSLEAKTINEIPSLLGEPDVIKSIQLLPGVSSGGDANSGFYVRGGSPDQNLVLLDKATIYNPSHMFGFFSVFNASAIESVELTKGAMPARYGGRLSSVLDISSKDPNLYDLKFNTGVGLVSANFSVEGPLVKEKTAVFLSARRTYFSELSKPFLGNNNELRGSDYYFYDLNFKIKHHLSANHQLFLSTYSGSDDFRFHNDEYNYTSSSAWGNRAAVLGVKSILSEKLRMDNHLIFSDYRYVLGNEQEDEEFQVKSNISNQQILSDFYYYLAPETKLEWGFNYQFQQFKPNTGVSSNTNQTDDINEGSLKKTRTADLFTSFDSKIGSRLNLVAGLRYTMYALFDLEQQDHTTTQTTSDNSILARETLANYNGFEPRINLSYLYRPNTTLKTSFSRNYQFLHLASFPSISVPSDIWVPSSSEIKPQIGTQFTFGWYKDFHPKKLEASIEIYSKKMKNLVEYRENLVPDEESFRSNPANNFVFGNGKSYGSEFLIKKRIGKFNGWLGYTLAWALKNFPDLNLGRSFFAKYDRRHDLSLSCSYKLSSKWSLTSSYIYASGDAYTVPSSRYLINGTIVLEYDARNNYRMPPYHRLDLAVKFTPQTDRKTQSSWTFSLYNVYNRKNPYFIYFAENKGTTANSLELQAIQVSLFGIVPSIHWNLKF